MNIGDILFFYETTDIESNEIKKIDVGYNNISYYHCAIYIGNNEIIEAIEPKVIKTSLDKYKDHPYLICSTNDNLLSKKATEVAKTLIDYPYNTLYLNTNNSFYCSSLIHYVYKIANNAPYFKEHYLKFRDNSNNIPEYWINLYSKHNMEVPESCIGSNPSNLSLDNKFNRRYFRVNINH